MLTRLHDNIAEAATTYLLYRVALGGATIYAPDLALAYDMWCLTIGLEGVPARAGRLRRPMP
jgi:hypothetical protein